MMCEGDGRLAFASGIGAFKLHAGINYNESRHDKAACLDPTLISGS